MKRLFRDIYIMMLAAVAVVMAACSSDDAIDNGNGQLSDNNLAEVRLHIAPATTSGVTRAWQDPNATDDEMMNIWVVIITTDANVVEKVIACKPTGTSREVDAIENLPLGTHKFYSFANMSVDYLATLLGITINMPTMSADDTVYEATTASGTVNADKNVTVIGNGFDRFDSEGDGNLFGSYGIPMSNVQTATIANNTSIDLIVVRMLAKLKVSVQNQTGAAQYIKYASITSITDNVDNNLKLLPSYTTASSANKMEAVHGDIQPNLNGTPATVELAIPGMATTEALANNATREVTFYVNECATGSDFNLTIGLGDALSTQEYRYALINQKGATTADDDKWDYIARNDYRIIPIILDDYKLELIPYDFPPIGVYPVSVSEVDTENHIYNFTFHDYGHFHLVPKVTKISDNTTVAYSATAPSGTAWTLNSDFAGSWKTAATKGGAWDATGNPDMNTDPGIMIDDLFYRDEVGTADGDEAGGVPVWYANDGTTGPQWDPAGGTTYSPFIFGYIAEPPAEWWDKDASDRNDRQVYHEFRVRLYVGGTYRRDLLYRFYMTLSKDQMLGAPAYHAVPRHKH